MNAVIWVTLPVCYLHFRLFLSWIGGGGGGADVFVWVFLKGDALIHSRKLKGHNFFRKKNSKTCLWDKHIFDFLKYRNSWKLTSNYSRIKIHLLVKKANLLLDKIRLNSTLETSPLHSHVIFFVRANKQKNIYPIVFEFRVWSKTFWTRALGFRTTKLRRNPPGNWVVLKFSVRKPCTKIILIILHSSSHFSRDINWNYSISWAELFEGRLVLTQG